MVFGTQSPRLNITEVQHLPYHLNYIIAIAVTLFAPACWIGTLLGLPGNWGMVAVAVLLAYFVGNQDFIDLDSTSMVSILLLAIAGEVAEFLAGAAGVNKLGGSKRGAALAIVGSVVGAILGMFVGVPIPILGSLIAALVFGGVGAFGGAVLGERWSGKDWNLSIRIGWGALWGKLLGTLIKAICGTVMMLILVLAVWH